MSGHSHWATIRRKKGAADAKKGAIFTRFAREILMAAREGGGDPSMNIHLQLAIERARAQNMPKDSIDRAIKRGTGESKDGSVLEEITYEGYASHGVALMIECVTDNRNRAVSEIRHTLTRSGGTMGESGSVGWQFTRASYFEFPAAGLDPDKIFELAVEAGANDVQIDDESIEILAPPELFKSIGDRLKAEGIHPEDAGLRMIPNQELELPTDEALQVLRIVEGLEELDDVQNVYHNLHISDEVMTALDESE
jgi:YebC/PmpR family DNA-binding regulatory protein